MVFGFGFDLSCSGYKIVGLVIVGSAAVVVDLMIWIYGLVCCNYCCLSLGWVCVIVFGLRKSVL